MQAPPDYDRCNRALAFAARAHHDQVRKGTNKQTDDLDAYIGVRVPYLMHLPAVAMILIEYDASDDAFIAGILHDVVEDANVPVAVIEQEFDRAVTHLVVAEREPGKTLPWRERNEHTIEHLKPASEDVKLIAAADKLPNVQSIRMDKAKLGDSVWERFNSSKDGQGVVLLQHLRRPDE